MYESICDLLKGVRNCCYYVHKLPDDVKLVQVLLRISALNGEMKQSDREEV